LTPTVKLEPLPRVRKSSLNATSKPVAKRKIKKEKGEEDEEELPNELEVELNLRSYHGAPKNPLRISRRFQQIEIIINSSI
jgi:hypothetical protein